MREHSLTLEEMDLVFGSSGVAAEDQARMREINDEIGLTRAMGLDDAGSDQMDEKMQGREVPQEVPEKTA